MELNDDRQLSEDMDLRLELKAESEVVEEEEAVKPLLSVAIRKPDGETVVVNLEHDLSAMDAGKQIADQIGDGAEELKKRYIPSDGDVFRIIPPRISVKTPEGDVFYLDVLSDDSASSIRCRISQKTGIPEAELILLKGDKKVNPAYVPSNGDELRIKPRRISVSALDGTVFQLDITSEDTPETIRRRISEEACVS